MAGSASAAGDANVCRNRPDNKETLSASLPSDPMPRGPRWFLPNGVYHVTARGTGGISIFMDDVDRAAFLHLLEQVRRRFRWSLSAYCLLGTHYHLVVETECERLSRGMHRLNGIYAQRFNRRHQRKGHLFEERFSSWVVRDELHLQATWRYVLANPVRAGLCRYAEDWPWSGFEAP